MSEDPLEYAYLLDAPFSFAEGEALTVIAIGNCVPEEKVVSFSCRAELREDVITIDVELRAKRETDDSCIVREPVRHCETPPLNAGTYEVVLGEESFTLTVPSEVDPAMCVL